MPDGGARNVGSIALCWKWRPVSRPQRNIYYMVDCCEDKGCALEQLRERQAGTLKIALMINAVMFVVVLAAGLYASSTALLADSEPLADFLMALCRVVVQAVATHQDLPVALRQQPQHRGRFVVLLMRDRALDGIYSALVGDQFAERGRVLPNRFGQ